MKKNIISIIIPVYNESTILLSFYNRLKSVTSKLKKYQCELIFVNDGSTDDSFSVLSELAKLDKKNKILDLSRNFGKEVALSAGVHEADNSDAVICIDADLQHPPELIPDLIIAWQKGFEVVATIRSSIEKQPLIKRIGSKLFYWVMTKISGVQMKSQTTDFRLYDKKVTQAFRHVTERERMFRGVMDWMGFKKTYIKFKADARINGEAGYSYSKLWHLAINSITSFSLWPLRITGRIGVLITISSGVVLLWMLLDYLTTSNWNFSPLAIVVVANTFLMGLVLVSIGLVALYVGNIHTEVINRPLYIIRERLNFSNSPEEQKIK
ncbi:glycosyltransferase family 2 protein [Methylophilales bacterium]|nr:glycosyltransferase family 2 protein [Methylophilales bacterium]